jgi:hypothetical protein
LAKNWQKNGGKNWRFTIQNAVGFCKILILTLVLRKTPFFRRELAKIAENCY